MPLSNGCVREEWRVGVLHQGKIEETLTGCWAVLRSKTIQVQSHAVAVAMAD